MELYSSTNKYLLRICLWLLNFCRLLKGKKVDIILIFQTIYFSVKKEIIYQKIKLKSISKTIKSRTLIWEWLPWNQNKNIAIISPYWVQIIHSIPSDSQGHSSQKCWQTIQSIWRTIDCRGTPMVWNWNIHNSLSFFPQFKF